MPNIRMLPPVASTARPAPPNPHTIAGRTYSAAAGSYVDAPDHDAAILGANGWVTTHEVGATAARPAATPGRWYLDTTLGKLIVCDGAAWRDPVTGGAV